MTSRIVCITGGTAGIGRGIVEKFLADGDVVYTFSTGAKNVNALKQTHVKSVDENRLIVLQGAVNDAAFADGLMANIEAHHGKLDVLVNNAGIIARNETRGIQESAESWRRVFDINVFAPAMFVQKALPLLKQSEDASVVNISSVHSMRSFKAASLSYSTSKAALDMMTEKMAQELAPMNIRVNSVNPGIVETPMWDNEDEGRRNRETKAKAFHILGGKSMVPEDIAASVAFLCSKEARAVTGVILNVDAGYALS